LVLKFALSTRVSNHETLAATSGHPLLNSTTVAFEKTEYAGGDGTRASAKKYSMLSSKPVKLPRGETRPVAFCAKRPGGTALEPWVMIGRLSAGLLLVLGWEGEGDGW
jgi:hypothetical protein